MNRELNLVSTIWRSRNFQQWKYTLYIVMVKKTRCSQDNSTNSVNQVKTLRESQKLPREQLSRLWKVVFTIRYYYCYCHYYYCQYCYCHYCYNLFFLVLSQFDFLSFITTWVLSFVTVWVFVFGHNLFSWVLSQFEFLSCLIVRVLKFCHNICFWVLSQF